MHTRFQKAKAACVGFGQTRFSDAVRRQTVMREVGQPCSNDKNLHLRDILLTLRGSQAARWLVGPVQLCVGVRANTHVALTRAPGTPERWGLVVIVLTALALVWVRR